MIKREHVSMQEAATHLGVSRSMVERLCGDGYLSFLKIPNNTGSRKNNRWLVRVDSLEEFAREYTHEALPKEQRKGRAPILKAVR